MQVLDPQSRSASPDITKPSIDPETPPVGTLDLRTPESEAAKAASAADREALLAKQAEDSKPEVSIGGMPPVATPEVVETPTSPAVPEADTVVGTEPTLVDAPLDGTETTPTAVPEGTPVDAPEELTPKDSPVFVMPTPVSPPTAPANNPNSPEIQADSPTAPVKKTGFLARIFGKK